MIILSKFLSNKSIIIKSYFLLIVICGFSSCSEEASPVDVENYVIEATYELQKSHQIGRPGCFELVFPVTLEFPDDTTAEADSYANIKETIRSWKESNPDVDGRPSLQFPIEVINEAGEMISIADVPIIEETRLTTSTSVQDKIRADFTAAGILVSPWTTEPGAIGAVSVMGGSNGLTYVKARVSRYQDVFADSLTLKSFAGTFSKTLTDYQFTVTIANPTVMVIAITH